MKDERILVLKTGINKPSCDCFMLDGCTVDDSCTCCNVGIPYSEAIEKMARAMCNADGVSCNNCAYTIYDHINGCKEYLKEKKFISFAEAALNALLEDK